MSFWNFLEARIKGQEKGIPWFVNDKLKAYDFYKKNNIPTPDILNLYDSPDAVDFNELPESFCMKPANMHSAAGVMPLIRLSEGKYFDRLRHRIITTEGIVREQMLIAEKCKFKSSYKLIVEEGLGHASNRFLIPFDYKLYTFSNGVGLILQVDRNSDKPYISFLDGEFNPLPLNKAINLDRPTISRHGTPVVPKNAEAMLECAKRIPALLNTGFISVDMYSTSNGFYVGELTPAPGGPYFKDMFELSPTYDDLLGRLWGEFSPKITG